MNELKKEPVTALLILVNIVVFLIVDVTGGAENVMHMLDCGASYAPLIVEDGEVYRIFTSMFLHFGMAHLLNNMLVLFVLGQRLEPTVGKIRFLLIYLLGGLGGNILSLWADLSSQEYTVGAGASGAVFAVMGGMLYAIVRHRGRLRDLSIYQILVLVAFSVYFGFASSGVDNVAHVGGLMCGIVLTALLYHPRKTRNVLP